MVKKDVKQNKHKQTQYIRKYKYRKFPCTRKFMHLLYKTKQNKKKQIYLVIPFKNNKYKDETL